MAATNWVVWGYRRSRPLSPASGRDSWRSTRRRPRRRGATWPLFPQTWPKVGLSPRVRGNPAGSIQAMEDMRSIPASAGQPRHAGASSQPLSVYPRECGATYLYGGPSRVVAGLSPRVRGNRIWQMMQRVWVGSIPASAGQPERTFCQSATCMGLSPRVRGNHAVTAANIGLRVDATGLSPRVRGNRTRSSLGAVVAPERSIPASAGQPNRWRTRRWQP